MKIIRASFLLMAGISMLVFCSCSHYKNLENMKSLKKGMTKKEVIAIMGDPVTGETYCKPDVLFYYTDPKWSDGNITSDECSPLVFEKDKLIGWGQEFYKDYRQKDWK